MTLLSLPVGSMLADATIIHTLLGGKAMSCLLSTLASADLSRSLWMPEQGSTLAPEIDYVFDFITWLSIFFFVAIVAITSILAWRYRRRPDVTPAPAPAHNTPLELTWTVIPLFLVIAIFYVGMQGYLKLRKAPLGAYEVQVTAQKWSWSFRHPNGATLAELDVPAGKPVKLVMKSSDVLHSLFIPAFRVKQDVVPGRFTELWFEATTPGQYDLFCTEYCGTQHSQMNAVVNVWDESEFDAVMAEKAAYFDKLYDGLKPYEAATRLYGRCSSCHSVVEGVRMTGPSMYETWKLYSNGENRVMVDGQEVLVDANYIRESILLPQKHVAATYGPVMPWFADQLSEAQVDALVMMIANLDQVFDEDGNPKEAPAEVVQEAEEWNEEQASGDGASGENEMSEDEASSSSNESEG